MTSRPGQCVYTGAAAQNFARSDRIGSTVQVRVGARLKTPIPLGPDVAGPLKSVGNAWQVVVTAGFQQEDLLTRIFGKPSCYH
jgi:hypothetical protein